MGRRRLSLALGAALVLAGCGARPAGPVRLLVTRDLGRATLARATLPRLAGARPLALLLRGRPGTRVAGGRIRSLDGLGGPWEVMVNALPASGAQVAVHPGDRVWLDRHTTRAPEAPVGDFPEPFRHGAGGRRLPTVLVCVPPGAPACEVVAGRLRGAGVPVALGPPGAATGRDTLRLLVGAWPQVRGDADAARLERGPLTSGVYARPSATGAALTLLDASGRPAGSLGPGWGLVAAVVPAFGRATWLVTGSGAAGVWSAAGLLGGGRLAGAFAAAVSGRRVVRVPAVLAKANR